MTDGNRRLGVFIDDMASDERAEKLVASSAVNPAARWRRSARS
jgi:hypothetical protein